MKGIKLFLSCILGSVTITSQIIACSEIEGDITQSEIMIDSPVLPLIKNEPKSDKTTHQKRIKPEPQDSVLVCNSSGARAYHKDYCRGLRACTHEVQKISKDEAIQKRGLRACQNCY